MNFLLRFEGPHTKCFQDMAMAMVCALRELGHAASFSSSSSSSSRSILFGQNALLDFAQTLPVDGIVFNAEHVAVLGPEGRLARILTRFPRRWIWDYSEKNIEQLRAMGALRAVYCPIGYHPSMETIAPSSSEKPETEDIDVLFYGSMNSRRRAILDEIRATGLRVETLFNVYGEERDRAIARSKVVLNLHYYENPIFEIFRVSHLLANGRCVVSENGGTDEALEDLAQQTTRLVSASEIGKACRELVFDEAARKAQAAQGRAAFRKTSLVENIRNALAMS